MIRDRSQDFLGRTAGRESRRAFLKKSGSAAVLAAVYSRCDGLRAPVESPGDAALRARLAADPLRPQFHLLPAKNWMNDPNGPIYWKGHYHMFFQYNPNAAVWGDMHWAHAISDDMMHWRHLPVALAPTPGWDDADGCFTGSAVDDRGNATVLYTGVRTSAPDRATLRDGVHTFREVVCLATSADPELRTWTKSEKPVLQPPDDPRLTGFRDPFLWRGSDLAGMRGSGAALLEKRRVADKYGDAWYLGVGSGVSKKGGQVLLYRSKDLRQWEYVHPLASGKWSGRESVNPVESGEMWECPDFFSLGTKHVLLYSTAGRVIWEIGEMDPKELVFHSEKNGILDHGAYYAQKTQVDSRGNRVLWGWIPETRPEAEFSAAGWAGCMALPRILSIGSDGDLEMVVAPEAQALRGKAFTLPPRNASHAERNAALRTTEINNLAGEIVWRSTAATLADAARTSFTVADRGGPWFSLTIESPQGAPTKLSVNGKSIDLPVSLKPESEYRLFLDGSVAELICDRKHAITTRIYRQPNGPLHLAFPDSDGRALASLDAWQLQAISPDRLTSSSQ